MRTVKLLLATAVAALALGAEAARGVTIILDKPVTDHTKRHSGADKSSKKRNKTMTETYTTKNSYTGKVVFSGAEREPVDVTLEAYFVTRRLQEGKTHRDRLSSPSTIGTYHFEPGKIADSRFSFRAPTCVYRDHTKKSGNRRRSHVETTTEGERYVGVIVRAVHGDEVLAVATSPNNIEWAAAARKQTVMLKQ